MKKELLVIAAGVGMALVFGLEPPTGGGDKADQSSEEQRVRNSDKSDSDKSTSDTSNSGTSTSDIE